jgi:hypothetical protein
VEQACQTAAGAAEFVTGTLSLRRRGSMGSGSSKKREERQHVAGLVTCRQLERSLRTAFSLGIEPLLLVFARSSLFRARRGYWAMLGCDRTWTC